MATTYIDDRDAACVKVGTGWNTFDGVGYPSGAPTISYVPSPTSANKATFHFSSLSGAAKYLLAWTSYTDSSYANALQWRLLAGDQTTVLLSGTINERTGGDLATPDFTDASASWRWFGPAQTGETDYYLELNGGGTPGGQMIADAIRLQPTTDTIPGGDRTWQSGNWGTASTWLTSTVPSTSGNAPPIKHAVTVAASTSVGSSPSDNTTFAVDLQSGGSLTLSAGVAMVVKGNLRNANRAVTMGAGASLEFNSTGAGTPATDYKVDWSSVSGGSSLTANGTANSHCAIFSTIGGGQAFFVSTVGNGAFSLTYADVTRIGDATNDSFALRGGGGITLNHATFDHCGQFNTAGTLNAADAIDGQYVRFTNSQNADYSARILATAPSGGVTRRWQFGYFDKRAIIGFAGLRDVTDTYFENSYDNNGSSAWGTFKRNFVRQFGSGGVAVGGAVVTGSVIQCGFFADDDGAGNAHIVTPLNFTGELVMVIEYSGAFITSDSNDAPYGVGTWNYHHSVVTLDTAGNNGSANLNSLTGVFTVRHNSHCCEGGEAFRMNDGGVSQTGTVDAKNSIFWAKNGATVARITREIGGTHSTDALTSTTDYNLCINLVDRFHAGLAVYSGTPGTHDTVVTGVNPASILHEPTRNLATFAVELGSVSGTIAGKITDALTFLALDPGLSLAYYTHCTAGQAIINPTYQGKGEAGVDQGPCDGPIPLAPPTANGSTVTFGNFPRALNTGVVPAAGDMVIRNRLSGATKTASGVTVNAGNVQLTGVSPVFDGTGGRNWYTTYTAGTNKLTDDNGGVAQDFAIVINDVTPAGGGRLVNGGLVNQSRLLAGLAA